MAFEWGVRDDDTMEVTTGFQDQQDAEDWADPDKGNPNPGNWTVVKRIAVEWREPHVRQDGQVPIVLTDEEWMSIIDSNRDGLPSCCANISALRDEVIRLASTGGTSFYTNHDRLHQLLNWCFPDHEIPEGAIRKVMEQISWEEPPHQEHEVQDESIERSL